jgi:hypothetical protein
MTGPERSTWDLIRKRIAPVAFLAALALLATRTCGSELADVTLRLDPGAADDRIRTLAATVHRGDEAASVTNFSTDWSAGPRTKIWRLQLDPGSYRLAFRVTMRDGSLVTFDRRFEARANAEITIGFEQNLN